MSTLTSIALVLASTLSQAPPPERPPTVRTVPLPSITIRPPTPEQRARTEKFNACRAAAYGQDYLPQPGIWQIKDKDTTLYIFGSFHLLPTGFDWRSKQFDELVAKADKLILESAPPTPASAPQPLAASTLPPLRDRLTGERRAKWLGISFATQKSIVDRIDRLQDAEAALRIAALPTQSNPFFLLVSPGVETQLASVFRRASKPIEGLEPAGSGMALLGTIDPAVQHTILEGIMDRIGETKPSADPFRSFNNWARGEAAEEPDQTPPHPEMQRVLLDVRNAKWVPEVFKQLGPPGERLIVVGAAHLRGPNNLLELLSRAGIKAERISPTTPAPARAPYLPKPASMADCSKLLPSSSPFPFPFPPPPAPPPPPVITPAVPASSQ